MYVNGTPKPEVQISNYEEAYSGFCLNTGLRVSDRFLFVCFNLTQEVSKFEADACSFSRRGRFH